MHIHHVTYAMPNARNAQRKAIHMLQRSSHTPAQEIKHTPSSPRKCVKVTWSRGLVKISTNWSCVGTWIKAIFPFFTLSLRKWYLTSMCFVLEWSSRLFVMLMALVLSHWSGTWVYSLPKLLMVYVIQRSWEQQLAAATYSSSVMDWATLNYLREDQDTKEEPKNWQVPEVDFLSNWHLAKSVYEKPWKAKEEDAESQRPKSGVWRKYLKIRWPLAYAQSLEMLENERTDIPRTGCLASHPSSRGVTRSCSGTPSGPRVHLPRPPQELQLYS
jgi:hypothetical protein